MQKAFGRAVPWMALPWVILGLAGVARRRVGNAPSSLALGIAALGCGGAVAAHLLVHYAVSRRYFLQGTVFLLPVAGYGLAAAAAWVGRRWPDRRQAGRVLAAAGVAAMLAVALPKAVEYGRTERIALREAGEWISTTYGPGQWMMTMNEQPAYYARTQPRATPRTYAEAEKELTAAPGRLLVLAEKDFKDLEPGFRDRLQAGPLERVGEFPRKARDGIQRVEVYRSRDR
jgi:hypothetical protein